MAEPTEDYGRITLVGLVLETSLGLQRALDPVDCSTLGVGGQAFGICLRLWRSPGHTMRMIDLATQTGISPSGLTRSIDRLASFGLIRRENCRTDHRVSYAVLTEQGANRVNEAVAAHRDMLESLLGNLFDPEDERALRDLLERLRDRVNPEATYVSADPLEVVPQGQGR